MTTERAKKITHESLKHKSQSRRNRKTHRKNGEKRGTRPLLSLEFYFLKLQNPVDQAQKEESRKGRRKLTDSLKRERWNRHRRKEEE